MDISRVLLADDRGAGSAAQRRQVREGLYERLRRWFIGLPEIFGAGRKPPPYVVLLRYTLALAWFGLPVRRLTDQQNALPHPRHKPLRLQHRRRPLKYNLRRPQNPRKPPPLQPKPPHKIQRLGTLPIRRPRHSRPHTPAPARLRHEPRALLRHVRDNARLIHDAGVRVV